MVIPQLLPRRLPGLEVGTGEAADPGTAAGWGERSVLSENIPDHGWGLSAQVCFHSHSLSSGPIRSLWPLLPLRLPETDYLRGHNPPVVHRAQGSAVRTDQWAQARRLGEEVKHVAPG